MDFYNNFFLGKRLKNAEGLAAFSTVLGWVLSGPVSYEDSSVSTNFIETHSMRCDIETVGAESDFKT